MQISSAGVTGTNDHRGLPTLELSGVDVKLGMLWLRTMGTMEVDWGTLTMKFETNNQKVTIRGDPALTRAEISLKMMAKSWQEDDQGFLVKLRDLSLEDETEAKREEVFAREETETIQGVLG